MPKSKIIYESDVLKVVDYMGSGNYEVSVGGVFTNFSEEQYERCSQAKSSLELQAILSVERPEFWKGVVDQGLTPDVLGWEMSKAEVVLMEKELRNALYVLEDEPSRCPSLYDMFLFP